MVHGVDGIDEISLGGETKWRSAPRRRAALPHHAGGFRRRARAAEAISGGDAAQNAGSSARYLKARTGPRRDIVVANAAAALVAAGRAADFREGAQLAAKSIDSGAAQEDSRR